VRGKLSVSGNGRGGSFTAQKALAAIDWPALCWLKWHRGFPTALRAGGHGFRFGKARGRGALAFGFAILATLGLVFEIFVVEEVLFPRCKDKLRSAINALENAILKLRHSNCAPLSDLNM
jgi:hypothetical protein